MVRPAASRPRAFKKCAAARRRAAERVDRMIALMAQPSIEWAAAWMAARMRDIGRAAADVAAHGVVDVGVGRLRVLLEQRRRRHDLAGLAIAALRHLQLDPGGLHRLRRLCS